LNVGDTLLQVINGDLCQREAIAIRLFAITEKINTLFPFVNFSKYVVTQLLVSMVALTH